MSKYSGIRTYEIRSLLHPIVPKAGALGTFDCA
jgi:hypothetical protein